MTGRFSKTVPSLRGFVKLYATDWIVTSGLSLLFYYIGHHITGFKRHFSLTDTSLRFPHAVEQRVGTHALYFVSAIVPIVAQIIVNLLTLRSWVDFHHSTLGLLLSLTMTGSITQIVKVTVDVISRCIPIPGSADPEHGLSTVDICTQTVAGILEDGWRSFPSGHSSMAFAGLGFLTFYLCGKLHIFDTRGHASKVWLAVAPLSAASLVAISRTMDYRHHWHDVVAGSLLGLVLAHFAYRQYYPSLAHIEAHVPYMTRFEESYGYDNDPAIPICRDAEEDADSGPRGENIGLIGGSQKQNWRL
ncbi:PAP2-domain-containing protein [Scleroderma citrinum]